ncbi:hypothetical protein GCM10025868_25220 [Angustibacter aerolatus]|uniref:Aminopeptidase N n=1 Tax=Angustibacter aerolatus TaxID=1162965 RepID=A0ABQ6JK83_9ACTN|nr:hypothetical protein GCM10025868_25220 [Angustibacter aerolatus]
MLAPGQNWGALETPGCVTYRDEMLPPGRITDQQTLQRAVVIAHEMAHMWFGNLVTMRWWEDTWLNESFADYMGYRVADAAAGYAGTLVTHESQRKPNAYDADLRRSTHPVAPLAEDVPDVARAFANFDAISYAKGNSALRRLVTWLGDETFLAGVNAHLTRHRLGNATLADFVTSLDEVSDRDVRGWVGVWLRRSGFDTLRVTDTDGVPTLVRDGERPHRLRLTGFRVGDDGRLTEAVSRTVDVEPDGAPVPLPEPGRPRGGAQQPRRDVRPHGHRRRVVGGGRGRAVERRRRPGARGAVGHGLRPGAHRCDVGRGLPRPRGAAPAGRAARRAGACRADPHPRRRRAAAGAGRPGRCRRRPGGGCLPRRARRRLARRAWRSCWPRGWPAPRATRCCCAAGWPPTARTPASPSTRGCAGAAAPAGRDRVRRRRAWSTRSGGATRASPAPSARPPRRPRARRPRRRNGPGRRCRSRPCRTACSRRWRTVSGRPSSRLLRPWVQRYVEDAPALAARRSASFARVVGHAVPALRLDDEQARPADLGAGRRPAHRSASRLVRPARRPPPP